MNIKVIEAAYHRNGVHGTGFYLIQFMWYKDGADPASLLGMVFTKGDDPTDNTFAPFTSVIDRNNIYSRWYGTDTFDWILRQWLKDHAMDAANFDHTKD